MTTLLNKGNVLSPLATNHPYARLYKAVIFRAVRDLAQKEHQSEAREWLLSSESDHAFATAGITPDSIRQQMITTDLD